MFALSVMCNISTYYPLIACLLVTKSTNDIYNSWYLLNFVLKVPCILIFTVLFGHTKSNTRVVDYHQSNIVLGISSSFACTLKILKDLCYLSTFPLTNKDIAKFPLLELWHFADPSPWLGHTQWSWLHHLLWGCVRTQCTCSNFPF